MDKTRPTIIIKKKGGHGGHHGGAWKVAYADFVTAMMAFFLVMWLMSSSKPVQEAVGGYFRDPNGTAAKKGSSMAGAGENFTLAKDNMPKLKDQLEQKIREMNDFEKLKNHVEMTVTNEGLRIELTESASGTFFDSGSSKLNADGRELLITLARELGKLPNKLSIEGHTDSKPFATSGTYSNWELSTDRANSARRLVQANGVRPDQITQVRGFADQRLRKPEDPLDSSNRRISLIVQYFVRNNEPDAEDTKPTAAGGEGKNEEKPGEDKKSEAPKAASSAETKANEKKPDQKKTDAGKEVPAKKGDASFAHTAA
jgi:chemotaxis protein MotB